MDEIREKLDEGVEADAGPGMRQSVYAGYKRYIETVLGNGTVSAEQRLKAVTGRLDAMWKELDAKQRQDLLQFLSGYGLNYVPD